MNGLAIVFIVDIVLFFTIRGVDAIIAHDSVAVVVVVEVVLAVAVTNVRYPALPYPSTSTYLGTYSLLTSRLTSTI